MKPFILFLRESSYTGWKHEDPVKYSKHLSKTFGNPDELTNYRAVWYNKDGVKRIEVKDEYILHGSPAPHYDFVYSYIDLNVPHEIASSPCLSLYMSPIKNFDTKKIVERPITSQPIEYKGLTIHESDLLGICYEMGGAGRGHR